MTSRRKHMSRKRPTALPNSNAGFSVHTSSPSKSDDLADSGAGETEARSFAVRVMDGVESALDDGLGSLSLDDRNEILLLYKRAIDSASLAPALNTNEISDAVEAISHEFSIEGNDKSEVLRQFNDAMDSEQQSRLFIAFEYLAKLENEGAEKALLWLKHQKAKVGSDELGASRTEDFLDTKFDSEQSKARSRSRRVRGPPK